MNDNIFEIKNLCKNYPGVQALKNINLDIIKNTVHCIVGENGAGKSTLIKILTCAEDRTSGEIFYNGTEFLPHSIRDAMGMGISTLFQELNVVDQLTVEENLTLGREHTRFGILKKADESDKVFTMLAELAPGISRRTKVSNLSYAEKQIVEIVKAVGVDANLIIMDEPTASLSDQEAQQLFAIIKELKNQGITIIFISHILDNIFKIGDYVSVFRDGNLIGTERISDISTEMLIKMTIGKEVEEHYISRPIDHSKKVLDIKNLTTKKLKNINFDLNKGEIIGFYGLLGAGKSEIAQALYGLDVVEKGRIKVNGKAVSCKIPKDSMKAGIAMVPEERLSEGLIMQLSIRSNISITNLKKISKLFVVDSKREKVIATEYIKKMNIKAKSPEQRAATLSGGNQQKVVVSKCLNADSLILLMDEPTRGIDVGAKEEMHNVIRKVAEEGASIIVFSSEYPEIVNLCDRIFLLCEGEIIKVVENKDARIEEIMRLITTRGKSVKDEHQNK